jgi:phosphate-selective porin
MRTLGVAIGMLLGGLSLGDRSTGQPQPEPAAPTAGGAWHAEASPDDGLTLRNDRSKLHFRLGGRLHLDARFYDRSNDRHSGLELQSLVPALSGAWGDHLDFLVRPDLVGTDEGDRNLRDAWVRLEADPALRLTLGQFKVPFGTEYASSIDRLSLPGRSFVAYLNGSYDVGALLDGSALEDGLYWAAFATAGIGYGLEGTRTGDPIYGARLVFRPLGWAAPEWLHGLTLGGTVGWSPSFDGRLLLATPLESTVFRTERFRGGRTWRQNLEIGYRWGPCRVRWEWAEAPIRDVRWAGVTADIDQNGGWMAEAAVALTGERYSYREGRETGLEGVAPVDPSAGRYGAAEVALRYSNADIDRDFFRRGLTRYDPSTQEVRTLTAGLNWYARRNLRLMFAWVKTIADDDLSTFGGTDRDESFVVRLQVDF